MDTKYFSREFETKEIFLIRISVFFLFIGRAWQGLFWDLPLRAFFWDQNLLEGLIITLTNDTWQNYVTNKSVDLDSIVNNLGFSIGLFWLLCAILSLYIKESWKWSKRLIYVGSFSLFLLALLYYKNKFYAIGQLFEYAIQIISPIVLIYVINGKQNNNFLRYLIKIVIAITFICHGLYACAFYPIPGTWVQWSLDLLFFSSDISAKKFLFVMGLIDFLAALGLFFKFSFKISIWYCIIWGFLTAIVRLIANFYINIPIDSLNQWAFEMFFRLVHGALPLFLYCCSKNNT
ncbi:MAG: hypothetical protein MK207_10180 [Saprospiraceae bacterium]|nr:hypothetical protein [Saprospiraceae bacterium]